MVIPSTFVLHTIVAVGVLGVGVPLGGSTHLAVFIGHHHVSFSRGLAGELEGHIGEPVHIGLAALTNLDKLQVATNYLVVGSIAVPVLDDLSILADLERPDDLVGVKVPFAGFALHHLVGSVG